MIDDCKKNNPEPTYTKKKQNTDCSWVNRQTNEEKTIFDYIIKNNINTDSILHVGTGNSDILKIKHKILHTITILKLEAEKFNKNKKENNFCFFINKYDNLQTKTNLKYDLIIDNNIPTYSCCKNHVLELLKSYKKMLKENGVILTTKGGITAHTEVGGKYDYDYFKEQVNKTGLILNENNNIIMLK